MRGGGDRGGIRHPQPRPRRSGKRAATAPSEGRRQGWREKHGLGGFQPLPALVPAACSSVHCGRPFPRAGSLEARWSLARGMAAEPCLAAVGPYPGPASSKGPRGTCRDGQAGKGREDPPWPRYTINHFIAFSYLMRNKESWDASPRPIPPPGPPPLLLRLLLLNS